MGGRRTCCLASIGRMTSATCRDSRFHLSSLSLWHCRRTSVNISSTCGEGPDARARPARPRCRTHRVDPVRPRLGPSQAPTRGKPGSSQPRAEHRCGTGPLHRAPAPMSLPPVLRTLQRPPPAEDGLLQQSSPWLNPSLVVIPPKQRPLNACLVNMVLRARGHREPAARTAPVTTADRERRRCQAACKAENA